MAWLTLLLSRNDSDQRSSKLSKQALSIWDSPPVHQCRQAGSSQPLEQRELEDAPGEADGSHALGVGSVKAPQALACAHLPHLQQQITVTQGDTAITGSEQYWLVQAPTPASTAHDQDTFPALHRVHCPRSSAGLVSYFRLPPLYQPTRHHMSRRCRNIEHQVGKAA